jgi:hypothetical protein
VTCDIQSRTAGRAVSALREEVEKGREGREAEEGGRERKVEKEGGRGRESKRW